ncbi:hypothetical protein JCM10207_002453 [Rhodosporidiobolus poonsookiae]
MSSSSNAVAAHPREVRWGQNEVMGQPEHADAEQHEPLEEEDEDDGLEGSLLAISAVKNKLGCCYYDCATRKLHFIEDQSDSSGWDLTNLILEQLLPSAVITSSNADADFLETLDETLSTLPVADSTSSASSENGQPVRLEYRPAREFYAGQGKLALAALDLCAEGTGTEGDSGADEDNDAEDESTFEERDAYDFGRKRKKRRVDHDTGFDRNRRNRELRLEGFLNSLTASPLTLGCAGALLGYLSRKKSLAGELEGDDLEVTGIELLNLNKIMHINADALASLQIFADESHASTHSSAIKEGLSLFGIVNLARTPLGRKLLKQWFIRPSLELDVIEGRHLAVECFLHSENQHVFDAIQSLFRRIKDTSRTLKTLASGRGGIKEWQTIWEVLYGAIMIRDASLNLVHRKGVEIIDKVVNAFDPIAFKDCGNMITEVIDWEDSSLQKGRVCVRPGVDADLDEWRRMLSGLPHLLSKVAISIASALPAALADSIAELSVVYFPQLGYLITIPYEPDAVDAGKYGEVGWDFQFVTEMNAYFKNDKCYDLDKHVGDLNSFITDKEIEIIHALLQHLLRLTPSLLAASDALAELDCLIAFAEAAQLYEWIRPEMVEKPVCEIVGGRHPLAELCVESFVKNSTSLVGGCGAPAVKEEDDPYGASAETTKTSKEGKNSMAVITGANFSGKSVYLKQVALIVFMAHIGCFVPAEKAIIGLTDRILTRVSTRESVTRGSSAFMIDLQQISFALRNLTRSSLLVVDEFGKGTEADDGAGLFVGVVEWLSSLGEAMPRTLIATHFQHVFTNGILSRRLPGMTLAHMEVLVAEENAGRAKGAEELTYLYRLQPGISVHSHAAACASLFGLPLPVVARAVSVTHLASTFSLDALALAPKADSAAAARERREVEEGERVGRALLEWDLDEEVGSVEEVKERLRAVLEVAA